MGSEEKKASAEEASAENAGKTRGLAQGFELWHFH